MLYFGIISKYGNLFDRASKVKPENTISLGEGNTPLVQLRHLKRMGIEAKVYAKIEGQNPTGSFKDRGMTAAISNAKEKEYVATVCASTGNTSASAAAYSAAAGMTPIVILPYGNVAFGKLAQALDHGAKIVQIKGNFDQAMRIAIEFAERERVALVNSLNPHREQGQKTVAFEVVDQLDRAPDLHFYPVGNGLNGWAHWLGYSEYGQLRRFDPERMPKMVGVQAHGAASLVLDMDIDEPQTIASAIKIGRPVNREKAKRAILESGGAFVAVSDEQIIYARDYLAKSEGIACEPASAASLAGMVMLHERREIDLRNPDLTVVLTLTGSGLKDTGVIEKTRHFDSSMVVSPTLEDVLKVVKW